MSHVSPISAVKSKCQIEQLRRGANPHVWVHLQITESLIPGWCTQHCIIMAKSIGMYWVLLMSRVYLLVSPCSLLLVILRQASRAGTSSVPSHINYRQGQRDVRRAYLLPWKQLEVNNEAWLLRFMSRSKIATMIKISVRWKTMVQPFLSSLLWNISSH